MIHSAQGLGEDVGKVQMRENMMQGDAAKLKQITKEEMPQSNVLGPGVIHANVLAQGDGALVVTVERREDGMTKVGQERRQPNSFLCSHGTCVELSFAGGESDRGGASRTPRDETTPQ
jgi:hypothetical protein